MRVEDWISRSNVSFGTSGLRGLVSAMTDEVCFAYTVGYLTYLTACGEFSRQQVVAFAGDLREQTPRLMRAVRDAICFMKGVPLYCGYVPTPALAAYAFPRRYPSLMITGSHIPSDRHGIKFNRVDGEFLKQDEAAMRATGVAMPERAFSAQGALIKSEVLPPAIDILTPYLTRYVSFFGKRALCGLRIAVYQHSAVGRDFLAQVLRELGAEIHLLGRSEQFLAIDTEAVSSDVIQDVARWAIEGDYHAIVSTDGDSDRPLIACRDGQLISGDLIGLITAHFLQARGVVTPITSSVALEDARVIEHISRTKIGSPYVVEAMRAMMARGPSPVIGYEPNGGVLLGGNVSRAGRELPELMTRDAMLPIISVLCAARDYGGEIARLIASYPAKFTVRQRIAEIPLTTTQSLITVMRRAPHRALLGMGLEEHGGGLKLIDEQDGFRFIFLNRDILHFRASGNAPELRIYAEASDEQEAKKLFNAGECYIRGAIGAAELEARHAD